MSKNKAPGSDGVTTDILLLGGPVMIKHLTMAYNTILKNQEIPKSWEEAKIIILFKKRKQKRHKKLPAHQSSRPHIQDLHQTNSGQN